MTQPYEKASRDIPLKKLLFNNFIGGIAWGLGVTVGLSLIFALLGVLAQNIDFVPIVGTFASNVLNFILANNKGF